MEAQLIEKQAVNATFKVTVPSEEVDAAFDTVLSKLAREVRVPGFRPGRAPRGVLVRRIGQEALDEEVRDVLVDANYPDAVRELDLMPVHAHFHPEELAQGSSFVFEVHVELYPVVTLPDLDTIVIDATVPELTDAMVEDAVERLRNENATLVPVERAIEASDYVLIESLSDEPSAEDGSEPQGTGSVTPVDLESASEQVKEQLIGKAMGDVIDLRLVDDVKTPAEQEAGDTEPTVHTLRMIVRDVKAKEKPDAGDDFAKTLGMDTWAEVLEAVRANLRAELQRDGFEAQREEFVDKLLLGADFDVPTSMVNRRQRTLLQNLAEDLRQRGSTLERYVAGLTSDEERAAFERELEESARRGVKRDIVLETLLEQRDTQLSDEEFDAAVRHLAQRQQRDVPRFRREMGEEWLENYRFMLRRDKSLRETVRELVGGEAPADEARAAAEDVADQTGTDDDEDEVGADHEHDHDHDHDHDHAHGHAPEDDAKQA